MKGYEYDMAKLREQLYIQIQRLSFLIEEIENSDKPMKSELDLEGLKSHVTSVLNYLSRYYII